MRLTSIYDIASLNPFQTPEIYNSTTLRLVYATFVTRDEKAEVMPWALASWNVVDKTTVDIVLAALIPSSTTASRPPWRT